MTPYWTIEPRDPEAKVPPRIEYDTLLRWLEHWPPRTAVLLEGHDGASSMLVSVEALIDSLALAPVIDSLFGVERH